MSTPASTILADVLLRIRDPNAQMVATDSPPTTATGTTFMYAMITVAQLFVNLAERLQTNLLTQYIGSGETVYDMTTTAADYSGKVVSCNVSGVGEIDGPVDYRALGRASRTWLTDVNNALTAPISWARIGCSLLAIVPAFTSASPPVVNIRYSSIPQTANAQNNMGVPDYAVEHVARLAELLCRIKTRQLTDFDTRAKKLATDMGMIMVVNATGGKAD